MSNDYQAPADPATEPTTDPGKMMVRDQPDTSAAKQAFINKWCKQIKSAKAHWKDDFDRMDDDVSFLSGQQWGQIGRVDAMLKDAKMVVNITQRHIQQRVAALYAKNPTVVARRRKTRDFADWDGTMMALNAINAQIANIVQTNQQSQLSAETMAQGQMPPTMPQPQQQIPPEILQTLADIKQGTEKRSMYDKIADTMEIIFNYTILQQIPPFKSSMKQMVRRVCASGIGWLKVGYQRNLEMRPEDIGSISGITEQMAVLKRLLSDAMDGELTEEQAEYEQLQQMLESLQSPDRQQVVREGLVFDFPFPKAIIVDPMTRHLCSLGGARWVAEEYILSHEDVKEIYCVDLSGSGSTDYIAEATQSITAEGEKGCTGYCVWEVWDKTTGEVFTLVDGYNDFLREPAPPVIRLKRFYPYFGLAFNELESSDPSDKKAGKVSIYPISDVSLLRPMQKEYNRARQGLASHRRANAPKIALGRTLDDSDIDLLRNSDDLNTTVMKLQGLGPGEKIGDVIQPIQMAPIDPNLYDVQLFYQDVQRVVGQSDASIGNAAAGVTATGDSIAEQSRTIALASQADDLDDMLTDVARASGELLLAEMSPEKAKEIAGVGAAWPQLTAQQIADEIYLEIEAGSSGRPNKAVDVANFQKIAPILLQTPGVNPEWFARTAIKILDDKIDLTDAVISGLPSMLTQAQIKLQQASQPVSPPQLAGKDGKAPVDQGAEGQNNAPQPPGIAGTQGGNPAAMGGMVPGQ